MKEMGFLQKYIFVLSAFLLSVKCEEWECGNDCKAILADGVLTVKGNGEMDDFSSSSAPWYSNRELIKSVVIEDGITTIGSHTFSSCSSLTSITIPNSVTMIGESAFSGCSKLTSIFIPKNVKIIDRDAFSGCSSLSTITVDEDNNYFKAIDNVIFSKDGTKLIFYAPAKADTFYSVPDDVIETSDYAFDDCTFLISGKVGAIEWNLDEETGEMTFTGEGK